MVSSFWLDKPPLLDNYIDGDCAPFLEEKEMAKINRNITLNGKRHCIRANTEQEYADKLARLIGISNENTTDSSHNGRNFADYARNWFEVYSKPNIATVTANTYRRQIERYLIPAFGQKNVEDISADDVQRLFNGMECARATKDKVKMVLNQILDNAIEDGLLSKNPVHSKRVKITGASSKATEPYNVGQMRYIVQHLADVQKPTDRAYLALQALHPLRLEEVLGLKWEDVDLDNMQIHICRAVTHPGRNRPEIKAPKTESSIRSIGLSPLALPFLNPGQNEDFVIGGQAPLSYTQVRKMCERIQNNIDFEEKITPIRFRTTVLTDLYNKTKDIKLAQQAAGHTTSAMTLKYYVKGREDVYSAALAIADVYTS